MLENAVSPIPELRNVKTAADMDKTKTGKPLTYDEYTSLLLSAAAAFDAQYQSKKKRFVYTHNLYGETDEYDSSDGEGFDIDSPISTIQAYAA
jgi:hypothetical protein